MIDFNVYEFLKQNVKPATGCTEPVVVAYACSIAFYSLFDSFKDNKELKDNLQIPYPETNNVTKISVKTDRDVYKNALAVYIPGTDGQKGLEVAVCLGLFLSPRKGLDLFSDLDETIISQALNLIDKVNLEKVEDEGKKAELYVRVTLEYKIDKNLHISEVEIRHTHDNVASIKVDGKMIFENDQTPKKRKAGTILPSSLPGWLSIVENISQDEIEEILEGVEMNTKISQAGLVNSYGLECGRKLGKLVEKGILQDDLLNKVKIAAACAGDARMGGVKLPVMSTAGSGNQGITAILPIAVVSKYYKKSEEKTAKAILLSHIVTKFAKEQAGHLSALCGCAVKAGVGATAGITYLLDGDIKQINNAINIMSANITGMICDGAKVGCSLKLACAAGQALESALMALENMEIPSDNGIVAKDCAETIENIGRTSNAMVETDLEIIRIMQGK